MMDQAIRDFPKQFKFRLKIEGGKVKKYKKFLVCGMGGSGQPPQVLNSIAPELDIVVHKDYGLPAGDLRKTLVIAMSYSGETEETISALEEAKEKGLPAAVVATGGTLIARAKQYGFPYVQIPNTGIQPRTATGLLYCALLKLMKQNELLRACRDLAKTLGRSDEEARGKELARTLQGTVPLIYASSRNFPLAYMWKIKFNETGKIPAFYNVFPELNHNEMTAFDIKDATRGLSEKFHFIFLTDSTDLQKNQTRMDVTTKLYQDRGLRVSTIMLSGENRQARVFSALILGDWTAFYTAQLYGLEAEQVPMVEEFKLLMRN
ncbi:bifunctional phosphoglucose/phosphomannose isomerase [Candidatus Uhrbacteria bacterium]|nr:bifunctional phosphoglucose/phosphomannose isomerase [Candidatus Uhrbacteria bacterium]